MVEDCRFDRVVNARQALGKKRRTLTKRRGRKRQDDKGFVEESGGTDGTDGNSRTCQVEVCLVTGP